MGYAKATPLDAIPSGCDCVWTVAMRDDGTKFGSIFIASDKCMKHLMHPRTFSEPASDTGGQADG